MALPIWQAGPPGARVEAAVRATLPTYCVGPGEKLIARPISRPILPGLPLPYPAVEWRVSCQMPRLLTDQPLITVNVPACEMRYVAAFQVSHTQKLAVCP